MGKANNPFKSIFSYALFCVGLLGLSGCAASDPALILQSGRTVGLVGLEGRWVGPVSPIGPTCGPSSSGLMNIGNGEFAFDPFQSTVVIRGKVADGRLNGALERIGGDRRLVGIEFGAMVVKAADGAMTIEGELVSGPCRWRAQLHRG